MNQQPEFTFNCCIQSLPEQIIRIIGAFSSLALCFFSAKTDEALRAKVAKREEENKKKQEEGETPVLSNEPKKDNWGNRIFNLNFHMYHFKTNVTTIETQQHKRAYSVREEGLIVNSDADLNIRLFAAMSHIHRAGLHVRTAAFYFSKKLKTYSSSSPVVCLLWSAAMI